MRVLIATNYLAPRDGATEVARLCGRALEARGHEVVYLASQDPRNPARPEARHFVRPTVLDPPPRGWGERLRATAAIFWSREARARLEALLAERPVDAALLHNIYHHISPSIIAVLARRRIPFALWLHDYKILCPNYTLFTGGAPCTRCLDGRFVHAVVHRCVKRSRAKSLLCAVEGHLHRALRLYARARIFVAPSRFMASMLSRAGFPRRRTTVLSTPARPPIGSVSGPAASREILYLGRLAEVKGLRVLLDALARLDDPPPAILAGEGPLREELERAARARSLPVRLPGFLDPVARDRALARCRALVLPSIWYENAPVVVREAQAAGKPVIASRTGGIPEIVADGEDGFLVPAGDPEALARAIEALDRDAERARAMGERGRRRALATAGLEAYGDRVAAICRRLIDGAAQAGRGDGGAGCRGSRPLRIALVGARGIPARGGGVERYAEEVGARLAARGARVLAFVRPRYLGLPYRLPRRLPPCRGVERISIPALAAPRLEAASHVLLATIAAAARRVDRILFLHLGPGAFAPIARAMGIPAILVIQGLDWKRGKWEGWARELFRRAMEPVAVRSANRVIAVSRHLARYVRETYGIEAIRIPNGVDPVPAPPARAIEAAYGLRPRGYFLFLARLVAEKRPDLAIEAFRSVETAMPLVVAGGGDPRLLERLRALAAGDPRILFTGHVSGGTLEALQAHAYAYVLPSALEGLAISLLEALRFDVPAIVSDIEANREVVLPPAAPKAFGLAFREGDVRDLARAIRRLAEDPGLREELARGAGAHVAERFSWDRIAREVEEVLAAPRRPAPRRRSSPTGR